MVSKKYPFSPYPIGWFQVAYCDELEVGTIVPLKYFGQDLVAFRGEDGDIRVLDAHAHDHEMHLPRVRARHHE